MLRNYLARRDGVRRWASPPSSWKADIPSRQFSSSGSSAQSLPEQKPGHNDSKDARYRPAKHYRDSYRNNKGPSFSAAENRSSHSNNYASSSSSPYSSPDDFRKLNLAAMGSQALSPPPSPHVHGMDALLNVAKHTSGSLSWVNGTPAVGSSAVAVARLYNDALTRCWADGLLAEAQLLVQAGKDIGSPSALVAQLGGPTGGHAVVEAAARAPKDGLLRPGTDAAAQALEVASWAGSSTEELDVLARDLSLSGGTLGSVPPTPAACTAAGALNSLNLPTALKAWPNRHRTKPPAVGSLLGSLRLDGSADGSSLGLPSGLRERSKLAEVGSEGREIRASHSVNNATSVVLGRPSPAASVDGGGGVSGSGGAQSPHGWLGNCLATAVRETAERRARHMHVTQAQLQANVAVVTSPQDGQSLPPAAAPLLLSHLCDGAPFPVSGVLPLYRAIAASPDPADRACLRELIEALAAAQAVTSAALACHIQAVAASIDRAAAVAAAERGGSSTSSPDASSSSRRSSISSSSSRQHVLRVATEFLSHDKPFLNMGTIMAGAGVRAGQGEPADSVGGASWLKAKEEIDSAAEAATPAAPSSSSAADAALPSITPSEPLLCLLRDLTSSAPFPPAVYNALLRAAVLSDDPDAAAALLSHAQAGMAIVAGLTDALALPPAAAASGGVSFSPAALTRLCAVETAVPDVRTLTAAAEALDGSGNRITNGLGPRESAAVALSVLRSVSPLGIGLRHWHLRCDTLQLVARMFTRHGMPAAALDCLRWSLRATQEVEAAEAASSAPTSGGGGGGAAALPFRFPSPGVTLTELDAKLAQKLPDPVVVHLLRGSDSNSNDSTGNSNVNRSSGAQTSLSSLVGARFRSSLFDAPLWYRRSLAGACFLSPSAGLLPPGRTPPRKAPMPAVMIGWAGKGVRTATLLTGSDVASLSMAAGMQWLVAATNDATGSSTNSSMSPQPVSVTITTPTATALKVGKAMTVAGSGLASEALELAQRMMTSADGPEVVAPSDSNTSSSWIESLPPPERALLPLADKLIADAAISSLTSLGQKADALSLWRSISTPQEVPASSHSAACYWTGNVITVVKERSSASLVTLAGLEDLKSRVTPAPAAAVQLAASVAAGGGRSGRGVGAPPPVSASSSPLPGCLQLPVGLGPSPLMPAGQGGWLPGWSHVNSSSTGSGGGSSEPGAFLPCQRRVNPQLTSSSSSTSSSDGGGAGATLPHSGLASLYTSDYLLVWQDPRLRWSQLRDFESQSPLQLSWDAACLPAVTSAALARNDQSVLTSLHKLGSERTFPLPGMAFALIDALGRSPVAANAVANRDHTILIGLLQALTTTRSRALADAVFAAAVRVNVLPPTAHGARWVQRGGMAIHALRDALARAAKALPPLPLHSPMMSYHHQQQGRLSAPPTSYYPASVASFPALPPDFVFQGSREHGQSSGDMAIAVAKMTQAGLPLPRDCLATVTLAALGVEADAFLRDEALILGGGEGDVSANDGAVSSGGSLAGTLGRVRHYILSDGASTGASHALAHLRSVVVSSNRDRWAQNVHGAAIPPLPPSVAAAAGAATTTGGSDHADDISEAVELLARHARLLRAMAHLSRLGLEVQQIAGRGWAAGGGGGGGHKHHQQQLLPVHPLAMPSSHPSHPLHPLDHLSSSSNSATSAAGVDPLVRPNPAFSVFLDLALSLPSPTSPAAAAAGGGGVGHHLSPTFFSHSPPGQLTALAAWTLASLALAGQDLKARILRFGLAANAKSKGSISSSNGRKLGQMDKAEVARLSALKHTGFALASKVEEGLWQLYASVTSGLAAAAAADSSPTGTAARLSRCLSALDTHRTMMLMCLGVAPAPATPAYATTSSAAAATSGSKAEGGPESVVSPSLPCSSDPLLPSHIVGFQSDLLKRSLARAADAFCRAYPEGSYGSAAGSGDAQQMAADFALLARCFASAAVTIPNNMHWPVAGAAGDPLTPVLKRVATSAGGQYAVVEALTSEAVLDAVTYCAHMGYAWHAAQLLRAWQGKIGAAASPPGASTSIVASLSPQPPSQQTVASGLSALISRLSAAPSYSAPSAGSSIAPASLLDPSSLPTPLSTSWSSGMEGGGEGAMTSAAAAKALLKDLRTARTGGASKATLSRQLAALGDSMAASSTSSSATSASSPLLPALGSAVSVALAAAVSPPPNPCMTTAVPLLLQLALQLGLPLTQAGWEVAAEWCEQQDHGLLLPLLLHLHAQATIVNSTVGGGGGGGQAFLPASPPTLWRLVDVAASAGLPDLHAQLKAVLTQQLAQQAAPAVAASAPRQVGGGAGRAY